MAELNANAKREIGKRMKEEAKKNLVVVEGFRIRRRRKRNEREVKTTMIFIVAFTGVGVFQFQLLIKVSGVCVFM